MTIAGMVVGTISYMAPEQALGRSVDHRADLFSLGVVLYELATGRMPFAGASPTEIIDKILHETPAPPSSLNAAVPKALDAIVARALEKSPTFRYQTARDMRQDLRDLAGALEESVRVSTSRAVGRDRQPAGLGDRALGGGDDLRQHHPRAGRRLDRHRHRGDRQLGSQEHPRPDRHRPGARLRRAAQPRLERQPRRVAGHRHRPPARRDLGRGRRLPEDGRAGAHHRELRRRRDRRRAPDGEGRRPRRRHLRAAGQDRLRAESGAEPGAARHRDRRDRAARNADRSRPTRASPAA